MDARPQTLSTVAGVSSSLFISLFINIRGGGDNSRFRSCMNIHTSAPHFTHDMIYLSICDKKTLTTILIYIYIHHRTHRDIHTIRTRTVSPLTYTNPLSSLSSLTSIRYAIRQPTRHLLPYLRRRSRPWCSICGAAAARRGRNDSPYSPTCPAHSNPRRADHSPAAR